MPDAANEFDLLIVGAGPAGCAAALRALREGARVCLVDRAEFPRPRPCVGWMGPAAVRLCTQAGIDARTAKAAPFTGLTLHSWDLRSQVAIDDDPDLVGWLVDRGPFDAALVSAARRAGADVRLGAKPGRITLGERRVVALMPDRSELVGAVLLIADGAFSETAAQAQLAPAGHSHESARCVYASFPPDKGGARVDVSIGASRAGQVATVVRGPRGGRLCVMLRDREAALADHVSAFVQAARQSGLLPVGELGDLHECVSPAGVALDMDTHVGKRCLLIGDAGGFVASLSNEGLYPAMRSGQIAAEVALEALRAPVCQDALAEFGPRWRAELADYLRMPNTDLALLMPLVFRNPQMSHRVARAFLLGQQF